MKMLSFILSQLVLLLFVIYLSKVYAIVFNYTRVTSKQFIYCRCAHSPEDDFGLDEVEAPIL